jgi:hypothetical protein
MDGASSSSGGSLPQGVPPFGGSSAGSGGPYPLGLDGEGYLTTTPDGIEYRLIVPPSYQPGKPTPFLLIYSGTEGSQPMSVNVISMGPQAGIGDFIAAVLHGVIYNGNAQAGVSVMDDVRKHYDVDDDRTSLMGESAGTTAALALGFHVRQGWFAAYWANDVIAADTPGQDASALGFAPWGQSGPGGQVQLATLIVQGMAAAGYRVPVPAPYDGPGSGTHGDLNQLASAFGFFAGKSRQ